MAQEQHNKDRRTLPGPAWELIDFDVDSVDSVVFRKLYTPVVMPVMLEITYENLEKRTTILVKSDEILPPAETGGTETAILLPVVDSSVLLGGLNPTGTPPFTV